MGRRYNDEFCVDDESEMYLGGTNRYSPEHRLLINILERAINDLRPNASVAETLNSLDWFLLPNYGIVTYCSVVEELQLKDSRIKCIENLIASAQKRLNIII